MVGQLVWLASAINRGAHSSCRWRGNRHKTQETPEPAPPGVAGALRVMYLRRLSSRESRHIHEEV